MGEILKGYNLGEKGVNVAKSPIHLEDGELVNAQNAEFYQEAGRGAIRKRPGLQAINGSSALAGSVAGIIGVPLVPPSQRLIIYGRGNGTAADANVSNDAGASVAAMTLRPSTGLSFRGRKTDLSGTIPSASSYRSPITSLNGVAYYTAPRESTDSRPGRIVALQPNYPQTSPPSARLTELVQFPNASGVEHLWTTRGVLYAIVKGTVAGSNFVYRVDPLTGQAAMIGVGTVFATGTEDPFSGIGYLGKLWIGTSRSSASTGRIYSARETDASWTLERTAGAGLHTYTSMAVYKGNLYAATCAVAGTSALIETRTPAGVWSTSLTAPSNATVNYFDALIVFNDELYAFFQRPSADICEAYKFDGTSWTSDEDLSALISSTASPFVSGAARTADALFVMIGKELSNNSHLAKRTTGGTWSQLTAGIGTTSAQKSGALVIL